MKTINIYSLHEGLYYFLSESYKHTLYDKIRNVLDRSTKYLSNSNGFIPRKDVVLNGLAVTSIHTFKVL